MTVSEALVLRRGEGRQFSIGTVKIESGAADFSVFESSPAPGAAAAPPHIHHSYDEAFYVIEGTVDFLLGKRRERLEAGAFVLIPRGALHSFANPGPGETRMLVIGSPPVQKLVEELGHLITNGNRPEPGAMAQVFQSFDSELVQ
jgi:mannose-6-phosphate isomerase-like protein (cupin superfamily)